MRSNLIYKISCSCGKKYIGQTGRNLYTRMDEHSKTDGASLTAVGEHISENPDHSVNLANPDVLGYSPYFWKRLFKESLFIQSERPELNVQRETKKLFLFNTV